MTAPHQPSADAGTRLVRDRLTLTLYGPFIAWGWFLYGFSPAVPLIATEQGISRGVAGLHGTAMALGTIVTGLVSHPLTRRVGRNGQLVIGALLTVVGVALLLVAPGTVWTLSACFVAGIGGNLMITAAQPALVVHHGGAGPAVVTEANAFGSSFGLLAPLVLGASVAAGMGWRPAVAIVLVLAAAAGAAVLRLPADPALGRGEAHVTPAPGAARVGFGRAYWLFWTAMVCAVAIEFSTTFWASDLVKAQTDAPASVAAASVSALVIGMSLSRFVVGPLSVHRPPEKLLLAGFAVAAVGWLLLWTATSPVVAVAGLVVAGLGYGTHYPLSIALALRWSTGGPDPAQARATLGTGAAVGLAPFLLGSAADVVGPHTAFLLVPILIAVGGGAVALAVKDLKRP